VPAEVIISRLVELEARLRAEEKPATESAGLHF
jgi:hypothetical protein